MTNHVHILATPRRDHAISRMMQSVGRRYVQYVNKRNQRTGTLWEGRYKASLVEAERYLLTCQRYIELNPVRAKGLADRPENYRWSSYHANALGRGDARLTAAPALFRSRRDSRRSADTLPRFIRRDPPFRGDTRDTAERKSGRRTRRRTVQRSDRSGIGNACSTGEPRPPTQLP